MVGVIALRSERDRTSSETSPFSMPFSLAVPASTMVEYGEIKSEVMRFGTPVAVMMIGYFLSSAKLSPRWNNRT